MRSPIQRTAWAEHLEDKVGIDPGLYRYQVRMNATEGAVAKLFRFRSARAFIEFLVEFTAGQSGTDAGTLEATTASVKALLDTLATRPARAAEQRFSAQASARLQAVHDADRDLSAVSVAAAHTAARADTLASSLEAAATRAAAAGVDHDQVAEDLTVRMTNVATQRRRYSDEAAELELVEAQYALDEATHRLTQAENAQAEARAVADGWRAVPDLVAVATLDTRIAALQQQLNAENTATAPLRTRHDEAAARLWASLDTAAATCAGHLSDVTGQVEGLNSQIEALRDTASAQASIAGAQHAQASGAASSGSSRICRCGQGDRRSARGHVGPEPVRGPHLRHSRHRRF